MNRHMLLAVVAWLAPLSAASLAQDGATLGPPMPPAVAPDTRPSKAAEPVRVPATLPLGDQPIQPNEVMNVLGERFESKAAGIAFRPPADMEKVRKTGAVEQVARYVNEKRRVTFTVTRLVLPKPIPLKNQPHADPGQPLPKLEPDMLEMYRTLLAGPPLNAKIVRECEIVYAGKDGNLEVGVLSGRYSAGPMKFLRQQALVHEPLKREAERDPVNTANPKDPETSGDNRVYYLFDLTTPTEKTNEDERDVEPSEKLASEIFARVLDSAEVLDLSEVVQDDKERLFRTRTLLVNLNNKDKIAAKLIPQQCYLITKEGKPIGYNAVSEEIDQRDGQEGIVVAARSRVFGEKGERVESATECFSTVSRKYESWVNLVGTDDGKGKPDSKQQTREVGTTIYETKRIFEKHGGMLDKDPKYHIEERYAMDVTQITLNADPLPVERALPPWYLPQAFSHLLPRLLPLRETKTYLFAVWVGREREVYRRYVDVEMERKVNLNGRTVLAIPVKDRIGMEGTVTYHYFSIDGRYLGSIDEESKIGILTSTPEAIKALWKDAHLTPPRVLKKVPDAK